MTPIDVLPPAAAISLANPEPAPNEPLQEVAGQADVLEGELARLALFEALARMLSAPGDEPLGNEQASEPMAGLIGMLLDAGMNDSLLESRSITG